MRVNEETISKLKEASENLRQAASDLSSSKSVEKKASSSDRHLILSEAFMQGRLAHHLSSLKG